MGDQSLKIPIILQKVSAGFPSPATDFVEDEIDLNIELIKNPVSTFIIRVQGNSMNDFKINDGDFLIVDRSIPLTKSCISVITVNNELVVKNIIKEFDQFYILSKDKKKIIVGKDAEAILWGVVTYIIHQAQ